MTAVAAGLAQIQQKGQAQEILERSLFDIHNLHAVIRHHSGQGRGNARPVRAGNRDHEQFIIPGHISSFRMLRPQQ